MGVEKVPGRYAAERVIMQERMGSLAKVRKIIDSTIVAVKMLGARGGLRRHSRGARQKDHRSGGRRQPGRKEGGVNDGLECRQDSRRLHQRSGHYLSKVDFLRVNRHIKIDVA